LKQKQHAVKDNCSEAMCVITCEV